LVTQLSDFEIDFKSEFDGNFSGFVDHPFIADFDDDGVEASRTPALHP